MVEFALALPILLLIILGLIEFSRLMFIYSTVTSASREAARYGAAIGPISDTDATPRYIDCKGIKDTAKRVGAIVGVADADIFIRYEPSNKVGIAASLLSCPIPADQINFGDRLEIEVRGKYNPVPAAPLVNIPVYEFKVITRRTIVKGAKIKQGGTAVGVLPTFTPDLSATSTLTLAPTSTTTPGPSPTVGFTNTPTFTPTPFPPVFPTFKTITWGKGADGTCNDVRLSWTPNTTWPSYPGTSPIEYWVYKNKVKVGVVAPSDPNATVWITGDYLPHNTTITYSVVAVFPGFLLSQPLHKQYVCWVGDMLYQGSGLPIQIRLIRPTGHGWLFTDPADTYFEVEAWDPTYGTANGIGISAVFFNILGWDSGGAIYLAYASVDYQPRYCTFGGNGPCNTIPLTLPNGKYWVRLRARAADGTYSSWVEYTFNINFP